MPASSWPAMAATSVPTPCSTIWRLTAPLHRLARLETDGPVACRLLGLRPEKLACPIGGRLLGRRVVHPARLPGSGRLRRGGPECQGYCCPETAGGSVERFGAP